MTTSVTAEREKAVADWEAAAGGKSAPEGEEGLKQLPGMQLLPRTNKTACFLRLLRWW